MPTCSCMTSSGTGGLESAVQNCFSPGDEVLVPLAGFFSERFKKLAEAYGLVVHTVDYEWGQKVRPDDVAARARRASREGRAPHPLRDLDRRDPARRAARPGGERRRRARARRRRLARSAPSPSTSTAGGSTSRSAGRRRRCPPLRGSRSSRSPNAPGAAPEPAAVPAVLLRLGDLPAVRGAARPGEPVDAGDQRAPGSACRARSVLPGRCGCRASPARDALARA